MLTGPRSDIGSVFIHLSFRLSVSLSVHFRYVVFHPFLDEILVGKIKYCSQEGVHGEQHLHTSIFMRQICSQCLFSALCAPPTVPRMVMW